MLLPLLAGCVGGKAPSGGALLEQLFIGLILGSVYALIALGYTLVYGVIKLINFAHGDIYMVGAFAGYYSLRFFIRWLNFTFDVSLLVCFALAVLASAVICAVLAMTMERLAYRPLRKSSRIAALITAVGVSFLLENLGIIVFGANPKSYEPKTLAVYQVQLAADEQFAKARIVELQETTQLELPAADGPQFARARLVSQQGVSAWGPVLAVEPDQPGAFVEFSPTQAAERLNDPVPPLGSIGYTSSAKAGTLTLSWAEGDARAVRLQAVFAGPDGRLRALELPIETSPGQPVRLPYFSLVIILTTAAVLLALNALINRSMFGISMRALSFDLNAAKLMGVNTDRVIAWTFAIGGACAALAGNMVGLYNQTIEPLMGILPGLKAFVAAVVGGIGSVTGAAAGGLIMGVSEALVKVFIPPRYAALSDALAFALLIVVLLFKPAGLFGRALKEKV